LSLRLHATGWGGLIALYFAPALRTWSFVMLCIFLIGYGLLHDWELARNFSNPLPQWTTLLRSVLAELKKPTRDKSEPEPTNPSED
jgi:hypothetical protein